MERRADTEENCKMEAERTRVTRGGIEVKLLRECQCVSRSGLVGILVATRLAGKLRAFSLWEAG
ncbi:hypothetical protein PanWU01x14_312990 [Parasponia andersonii]|uniref:Uncharacterized protein n=1 Tax=Parasponia andersonii TaxID=3476 RepID=A0A2P5AP87_PARAD|nr:hypothetical protein PanWU01x14_312990 [Parasponia andersonii]